MKAIEIRKLETEADRAAAFEKMTGWSPAEVERCCYDPVHDAIREAPADPGCVNKATVVVGARDELWLCDACAALPRFKRHKNLGPIRIGSG